MIWKETKLLRIFSSHSSSCSYFPLATFIDSVKRYCWLEYCWNMALYFVAKMKIDYKVFTDMMSMNGVLKYISLLKCILYTFLLYTWTQGFQPLFHTLRFHKNSRAILDSVTGCLTVCWSYNCAPTTHLPCNSCCMPGISWYAQQHSSPTRALTIIFRLEWRVWRATEKLERRLLAARISWVGAH